MINQGAGRGYFAFPHKAVPGPESSHAMNLPNAFALLAFSFAAALAPCPAIAEDNEAEEGFAPELEIGPAFDRDVRSRTATYGASLGAEATVIQQWLELEADVTRLAGAGRTELGFEFLLKKPFTLSQNMELMVGLGPEITRTTIRGVRTTQHAAEALLDFQYWLNRNFGFYAEPGYSLGTGSSRGERSVGASVGILLRW
jgi:hypothetical protein